jgi:hypothetical protein
MEKSIRVKVRFKSLQGLLIFCDCRKIIITRYIKIYFSYF